MTMMTIKMKTIMMVHIISYSPNGIRFGWFYAHALHFCSLPIVFERHLNSTSTGSSSSKIRREINVINHQQACMCVCYCSVFLDLYIYLNFLGRGGGFAHRITVSNALVCSEQAEHFYKWSCVPITANNRRHSRLRQNTWQTKPKTNSSHNDCATVMMIMNEIKQWAHHSVTYSSNSTLLCYCYAILYRE